METRRGQMAIYRGAQGALKALDALGNSAPLEEIEQFLLARWDARNALDPSLIERVVADVFRQIGFQSRVTGRSGDGGIDVVLTDSADKTIGVQVKRYQNRIEAREIREFAGALMLRGLTEGIFVTTSRFRSGAEEEATLAESRGLPIQLVDGEAFYDALGIVRWDADASCLPVLPSVYETRRLWRTR
jgi:restriction system protein